METQRYEKTKNLMKQPLKCTATYGRTGLAQGVKKVCLQKIMYQGEEILDHLWVENTSSARMGGHETLEFELVLVKRKRPGATIHDGPLIDVQAKRPVSLKIIKR